MHTYILFYIILLSFSFDVMVSTCSGADKNSSSNISEISSKKSTTKKHAAARDAYWASSGTALTWSAKHQNHAACTYAMTLPVCNACRLPQDVFGSKHEVERHRRTMVRVDSDGTSNVFWDGGDNTSRKQNTKDFSFS